MLLVNVAVPNYHALCPLLELTPPQLYRRQLNLGTSNINPARLFHWEETVKLGMLRRAIVSLCASRPEVIPSTFGSDPVLPYSQAFEWFIQTGKGYTSKWFQDSKKRPMVLWCYAAFHPLTQGLHTPSRYGKHKFILLFQPDLVSLFDRTPPNTV